MPLTESGLLSALEEALRNADRPLDCNELFEMPEIREHAPSVSRVSDYLGNLWRKGRLTRLPAPAGRDNKARWLYQWKGKAPVIVDFAPGFAAPGMAGAAPTAPAHVMPPGMGAHPAVDTSSPALAVGPAVVLQRRNLRITEHGNTVIIDLPGTTLTIQTL